MPSHRYQTPEKGELDWHVPLNENFERLNRDVEIRDTQSELHKYDPANGTKFFATDTGTTYLGDGTSWNLIGYVYRAGGGDLGHFVSYEPGLEDEIINTILLEPPEELEVVRISLPLKDSSEALTDVRLRVYDGDTDVNPLVEVHGNELKTAEPDETNSWVASSTTVYVTISNTSANPVNVVPKVWTIIRPA